nr:DUF3152 domain-containing protein [Phaeacidiphilus oryzae]
MLVVVALAGSGLFVLKREVPGLTGDSRSAGSVAGAAGPGSGATQADRGDGRLGASTSPTPGASASPTVRTSPTPTASRSSAPPSVPEHGTGDFTVAQHSGGAYGHGYVRRYEVEVEGGAGISANAAADAVQAILANPRGWTADGHDAFRLVSSGPVDFVIKIATPDTVDRICGAAGLDTHGEVNCDVGADVVVNLRRWQLGSPEFPGPVAEYRALIINHEVGHRIGHGHEGCPGQGMLAPVMMQQIFGLHGCRANAWPYDSAGHYIQGPAVA